MRNFKELLIWQKGMEIWTECYLLSKHMPKEERFGLISQMNRAASSIPANIAEGSSRKSSRDYARFIQISLGSAFELKTFFIGILRLELIEKDQIDRILKMLVEEQKMLSGFLKKLKT